MGKLLEQWRQEFTISMPSREGGVTSWAEWDGTDTFIDWYRNTVVPPKAHFLAVMEEMFRFHKDGEGYHLEPPAQDETKQIIFGIRPCDARALAAILDTVFKELYEDPYYAARRNNTLLVGLGCTNPGESCFCTSLGISPGESGDVDLLVTAIDDHFLLEPISGAGKKLMATAELEEVTQTDEATAKEAKEAVYSKVTRKVDTDNIGERLLACFGDEDYWEKVAAKCTSCGICTLLCPTCFCFDINDELVKNRGTRFRSWDSCAFPNYTKMPVENPREEKWQRVRQKVCHKFEFHPVSYQTIACVGCGRCIRLCPVNWDISQVINNVPAKSAKDKP